MPLAAGQTLTHYEILGPLGAGGMGEVYRAKDTRLDREVAIKVLPEEMAGDEERLRRFDREAKTLASLNHTNIAGIHGIDQVGDTCFLAIELVPGEDLEQRLKRGALPLDEALDVARQIAEGLEAAHEAGVVHRDLKPANVRITLEGVVKLLDFGLAKPIRPEGNGSGTTTAQSDSFLVTSEGMILGTPTYMSPEQARGKPVDRRTDIWAFGCVLYECLTGKRAFEGEAYGDLMAAILEREADLGALPTGTPPHVRELIVRCLVKNPRQRLRDIGEARVLLERPQDQLEHVADATVVASATSRLPWFVAAIAVAGAVSAIAAWQSSETPASPVFRSAIEFSPRLTADPDTGGAKLLSGGHRALYCGDGLNNRLYVRDLSELTSRPIAGTEGAQIVGASPDEQWYAFFADGSLKKISINGGDPITLAEATNDGRGGHWAEDGFIYYAPGTLHPIMRVPENGGEPEEVTVIADVATGGVLDNSHRWPTLLPGGEALLYLVGTGGDFSQGRVEVRELESGEVRVLQTRAMSPSYFGGYIGFVRDGALHVQGFDSSTLELTTPPAIAVDGVLHVVGSGSASYAVSDNGTLLYMPGDGQGARNFELAWTEPDSPSTTLVGPGALFHPHISPDGRRIAYTAGLGAESDVWIYDLESGQNQRLTLGANTRDRSSAWSPGGTSIAFASDRDGGAMNLYVKSVDGSTEAVRLTESDYDQHPTSWSSDGKMLLFMESTRDRGHDLCILRLDENARAVGEPEVFESSPGSDVHGDFSPDGQYVAFSSDVAGDLSVYVRSLDGTARWQVTDSIGWAPRWGGDGSLYYQTWEDVRWGNVADICRVDFKDENGTRVPGRPKTIGSTDIWVDQMISATFDVHPTDERVLVLRPTSEGKRPHQSPVLIQNWLADFTRLREPDR